MVVDVVVVLAVNEVVGAIDWIVVGATEDVDVS